MLFYISLFKVKMSLQEKIHNSILALAVCHNVTPVSEQQQDPMLSTKVGDDEEETVLFDRTTVQPHSLKYQASSPDEVSIPNIAIFISMQISEKSFLNLLELILIGSAIIRYCHLPSKLLCVIETQITGFQYCDNSKFLYIIVTPVYTVF